MDGPPKHTYSHTKTSGGIRLEDEARAAYYTEFSFFFAARRDTRKTPFPPIDFGIGSRLLETLKVNQ